MSKPNFRKYEGIHVTTTSDVAMNRLFVDLIGPLVRTKNQNQYILVVTDECTRFSWIVAIRDCKTRNIVDKLEQIIFNNFSVPRIIVTDNASYFRSHEFKSFMFKNYIEHRTIAAYRCSGNKVERLNRDIKQILTAYYHDKHDAWDRDLGTIQLCINNSRHGSTKFTPHDLMFQHPSNNAMSNLWSLNDLIDNKKNPETLASNLKQAIKNVKNSIKHNSNRSRYLGKKVPFKRNSLVFVKTHHLSNKFNKFTAKLSIKFEGPYRVLYFITPVTCIVQKVDQVEIVKKVHVSDLKEYK